jgi:DNA-binding XRE family transcriptional regulator
VGGTAARTIEKKGTGTELEIRVEIGRRIAEMRRKLGLSARKVAEELGISREAVTHIETGRNMIGLGE